MTILVRLHIFSGLENPVWAIPDNLANELLSKVQRAELSETKVDRGLGYSGFSILQPELESDAPSVLENVPGSDKLIGTSVAGQPELEEFLLSTAKDSIDADLSRYVKESILQPQIEMLEKDDLEAFACPPCGGGQAPNYNPGYWNNDSVRLRNNNCYNYGNNKATNTFAQPGRGSGQQITKLECNHVRAAAERDGLRRVPNFQASTAGWYVALVVWPGRDYHWFRQDKDGCWSHKPGQTRVRNVDNSGNRITDPRIADRGPYTDFCTYMVTNAGATIV